MITKAKDVDDFLNKIDSTRKDDLSKLRSIILKTLPDANETMQYGMPAYDVDGKGIVAFNSQKNYMSFYAEPASVLKNKRLLKGLSCGKSCIRFKRIDKLSEETIVKLIKDTKNICG
ncbi:MAG: DUF1801 domain-containing protein [Bacteroidota bacterium]|nr:DUF1801 domain-containing protein [Bacteroidota bacterium]